jgi:hypothetical protein
MKFYQCKLIDLLSLSLTLLIFEGRRGPKVGSVMITEGAIFDHDDFYNTLKDYTKPCHCK